MTQDPHFTKVVFRKFRGDGGVIALFPELPSDTSYENCMSYMRVGQHGAASVNLSSRLDRASPQDYADLKRELEGLGYKLRVMRRVTRRDYETRKAAILKTF